MISQGKIETQGDYNDVLNSGIDIASILNKSEENLQGTDTEIDGVNKNNENSSTSLKSMGKSIEEKNNEKNLSNEKENLADEQNALLNQLEASSKGKVKGSLIINYFKSARKPLTMVFIVVTFLLAQTLASLADIWVSYW